MFEFINKNTIWDICDKGFLQELDEKKISYQLKTAQDLVCYNYLRDKSGLKIAEIGGGNSRILQQLGKKNNCYNIEKFEGIGLGPTQEIHLKNVKNINAYVGEYDKSIPSDYFDIIFSISVIEHVTTENLNNFFYDSLRILKSGGTFLHAVDLYLEEEPSYYWKERFQIYRGWIHNHATVTPTSTIFNGPLKFTPDMCTNPDNIMYSWNTLAPTLRQLRAKSQNVSILIGGKKR
jgi:hypothetical protein